MATIISETITDTAGKEAGLAVAARVFLVAGIVFLLVSIALMTVLGEFFWVGCGVLCMILGVVIFMIFSALAEIIILLKKLCGVPCSGVVSGTKAGEIFTCSECGAMTWADSKKCDKCGVEFEPPDCARKEAPGDVSSL